MTQGPVSVIVVSRHRPAALRLCLLALTRQDHPEFEVIVVADPDGIAAVTEFSVKPVPFDLPNISAARNAGLARAAGAVVAFIDDDAVAEPTWLTRLVAPFADETVIAATGFVRGRNGISRQWGAASIDHFGVDHPFDLPDDGGVFDAQPGRAIKTQGTNCAFRRGALLALGGFDPAYRFYHDETDLNLRMAARTAVVPMAQVVHGFAPSDRRQANRVPTSLVEIAASTAVFLRRHSPEGANEAERSALAAMQAIRLRRHQEAGRLTAAQVRDLLTGLDRGWAEGLQRRLAPLPPLALAGDAFLPMPDTGPRKGVILSARRWQKTARMRQARALAAQGCVVTLICLSMTARPHWLSFTEDGYWLHRGGIFGRSDRDAPWFQASTLRRRVAREMERWRLFRPVG